MEFIRAHFRAIFFHVDYHDKNVLMCLNFCMAMKHHPIALLKTGLINSIVSDVCSKTKSVKVLLKRPNNTDSMWELIMQDRHVTYRELELSMGISLTNIHS